MNTEKTSKQLAKAAADAAAKAVDLAREAAMALAKEEEYSNNISDALYLLDESLDELYHASITAANAANIVNQKV